MEGYEIELNLVMLVLMALLRGDLVARLNEEKEKYLPKRKKYIYIYFFLLYNINVLLLTARVSVFHQGAHRLQITRNNYNEN